MFVLVPTTLALMLLAKVLLSLLTAQLRGPVEERDMLNVIEFKDTVLLLGVIVTS